MGGKNVVSEHFRTSYSFSFKFSIFFESLWRSVFTLSVSESCAMWKSCVEFLRTAHLIREKYVQRIRSVRVFISLQFVVLFNGMRDFLPRRHVLELSKKPLMNFTQKETGKEKREGNAVGQRLFNPIAVRKGIATQRLFGLFCFSLMLCVYFYLKPPKSNNANFWMPLAPLVDYYDTRLSQYQQQQQHLQQQQ